MMSLPLTIVTLLSIVVRIKGQSEMLCGKRLAAHTPLITYGYTAPQHWPWHAVIYHRRVNDSVQEYQCGGTVLTPRSVLTAGHCVYKRYSKIETNRVSVSLGRLTLSPNENWEQSFEVDRIDVHPRFVPIDLSNDIAIIRLATNATFNNFVRPICLWNVTRTDLSDVVGRDGTVIGFGLTENFTVPMELREASMPVVSVLKCLRSNWQFFGEYLSETTFCAGRRNRTSVCSGDSGGSMSFQESGSYYIRGIVSLSPSFVNKTTQDIRCDSTHYAVFTDVAKYLQWIEETAGMGCEKVVQCENIDVYSNIPTCKISLDVKLSERKCKILFSESANAAVIWLQIVGDLEAIGDFSDAVTKFENLIYLHLTNTKLQIVEREIFAAFGRLEMLYLSYNSITSIAAHTFDNLKNLTKLYLDDNQLKEIDAYSFAELGELTEVDFHNNKLEVIPEGLFRNNQRLEEINLYNNKVRAIHRDLFKGLGGLINLFLDGNELQVIPEGLFRDNLRLERILLENNKIKRIETNFQHLSSLRELILRGNVCIDENCVDFNSFCGTNSTSAMQTMLRTKCP